MHKAGSARRVALIQMMGFLVCMALINRPAYVDAGQVIERIRETRTLRVGVNPDYWPFSYNDAQGRQGVDIEIARLLAKSLEVSLKIIDGHSLPELIKMTETHRIDIIIAGLSRTFQRSRRVDFTIPYFQGGVAILLNRQSAAEIGIADATSYKAIEETLRFLNKEDHLKVIVAEGKAPAESAGVFFREAQIISIEVKGSNDVCIDALLQGRGHIFVHDLIYLKHWVAENPAKAFKLQLIEPPYKKDTYGFAVAKGNLDFVQILNLFIEAKLVQEGYMERFMAKHYKLN
jgi:ABC-type amino acid transport substrate-binding protein